MNSCGRRWVRHRWYRAGMTLRWARSPVAPNSTNVAGSGTRSRRRPSRSGFCGLGRRRCASCPRTPGAGRASSAARPSSTGGAGWVGLAGGRAGGVVGAGLRGRRRASWPCRARSDRGTAGAQARAMDGAAALAALRSQIFAMYGTRGGVTQPVSPWSTTTMPIRPAGRLRLGAQPLVPDADRDQGAVHAVPGPVARRRRCRPRSARAAPRKKASSRSGSLSASCAYRSQPACDVQSRSAALHRSARARTPGTCDGQRDDEDVDQGVDVDLGQPGVELGLGRRSPGRRPCRRGSGRRSCRCAHSSRASAWSRFARLASGRMTAKLTPNIGSRAPWRR